MLFTSKPLSPQGRHVLITGASSGLGRETALHLAEQGFQVIAGVRRQEDGERLANACPSGRISTLLIDVTDEESIGRAAAQVAEKVGDTGLWGLVNNAGICISAPLECVSSDLLRRQLEVNLIGQLAVTRAILPLLRRGGAARLVNVTSGLGSVAIPYLGAYSAAQFAKEALRGSVIAAPYNNNDGRCRQEVPGAYPVFRTQQLRSLEPGVAPGLRALRIAARAEPDAVHRRYLAAGPWRSGVGADPHQRRAHRPPGHPCRS